MALQVWLPLNGNLNNQGLTNTTFTGSTTFEPGKLGQAGVFGTAAKRAISSATVTLNSQVTIAFWIKIKTWVNWGRIFNLYNSDKTNTISCVSNTSTDKRIGTQVSKNGTNLTDSYNGSFDLNTWYHFAMVVNGTTKQHYINGSLVGTATLSDSMVTTNYTVMCGGTADNGAPVDMDMNDLRIYDHALSAKEIEVLSRGLVCHYPLSGNGRGGDNLLKNSNFLQGTNGMEGYTATGATCTKQSDCMKVVSSGASNGFFTSNFNSITTGVMTTFSAYVKADSTMTIYIGTDGSGNGSCQSYTIGTSWQRISISKEKTTNNANLRIYGQGTFYVKLLKYELGSIITPWIPNSADTAYTAMGYDSTTEYDVSGYGYNGTKTGTLNYSSDTARYNVSTVFTSGSHISTIIAPTGYANSYTFAWWGKYTNYSGHMMWGFINANRLNLYMSSGNFYWNTGDGNHNPFNISAATYGDNNWHHFVVTGDGTATKLYIDGEFKANAKTYKGVTGTSLYFNGWDNTTNYNFNGSLSDFRLYSTPLSAAQVAELYNTAVSVANNGTLMGYELVEG